MPAPRPDHTFVVLAYRDSPFLEECVSSLQAQSTPSSVIVTTSTPSIYIDDVARRCGVEVKVNPDGKGITSDWNFGLRAATTRFVTLAHQDDIYRADFLERSLRLFERHPDGALSFTGYEEINDDGSPRQSKITVAKDIIKWGSIGRRERVSGLASRLFLGFGNPVPCSSVTFDREKLPWFQFSDQFSCNLDWEAWWRLRQEGRLFLHDHAPTVRRRYNELTETSNAKRDGRRRREDVAMFRAIWPAGFSDAIALLYMAGY